MFISSSYHSYIYFSLIYQSFYLLSVGFICLSICLYVYLPIIFYLIVFINYVFVNNHPSIICMFIYQVFSYHSNVYFSILYRSVFLSFISHVCGAGNRVENLTHVLQVSCHIIASHTKDGFWSQEFLVWSLRSQSIITLECLQAPRWELYPSGLWWQRNRR